MLHKTGLLLIFLAACSHAQPLSSWERVEKLRPGARITCVLTDQSQVAGSLNAVTANHLALTGAGGKIAQVDRERIQTVLERRRPRGNSAVWTGLGVGVAAGLALAAGGGTASSAKGWAAVGGLSAGIFGGIGAGVGFVIRGQPKEVLVYRAGEVKREVLP